MGKVLLTGGSGFIAAHVLDTLLERGHAVVTTVRSKAKGDQILAKHSGVPVDKLSYVIVPDIAQEGAFDKAVQSQPPFEYVLHTASPFHHNFDDPVKGILDPAVKGTTGILKAIKAYAPEVKRVVVTSSFAAIVQPDGHPKVYDESSWNPVTWDEAAAERSKTYRGSKKIAEKTAWDFVENEKPNFDVVTMNPPFVFGPVAHHLSSLDNLNTSNERIRDIMQGKMRDGVTPTGLYLWTDVRDLALAHVRAIEVPEAGGKRFLITAGYFTNKDLVEGVRERCPELEDKLPKNVVSDLPEDIYGFDNSRVKKVLDVEFRSILESIGDTASSLKKVGA